MCDTQGPALPLRGCARDEEYDLDRVAEQRNRGAERLGLAGLYIFALFAWLGTAGANLGLVLMLAGMAWDGRRVGPALLREPAFHLFALFTVYVSVRAASAADEFPQMAQLQWDDAWGWLNLWFFLIAAWWLRGDPRRIGTALVLALVGLIAGMAQHVDAAQLELLRRGERVGFGHVALVSGLLSGMALIGLFIFAPRLWAGLRVGRLGWLRLLLWLVAVAVMFEVWLASQSRGAWLATVAALVGVGLVVAVRRLTRAPRRGSAGGVSWGRWGPVAAAVGGLLLVGVVVSNSGVFQNRIAAESDTLDRLQKDGLEIEEVPFNAAGGELQNSVGRRIHMLYFGGQRFLERPWFGWGPGTQVLRLFGPEDFESAIQSKQARMLTEHPHVHNAYLATLVRLGLAGGLLLAAGLLWVLFNLWRGYRRGMVGDDLFLFLAGGIGLFGIWSFIDARLVHVDIGFLSILLFGVAFSHRFRPSPPRAGTREAAR